MLCPEVSDFAPPNVHVFQKEDVVKESVIQLIERNNFYKSVIVTCPDEHNLLFIQKLIAHDTDYYKLWSCSLTEFVNQNFINYFIKCGKVTCLSVDKNCIVQNCTAITPDGILVIHIPKFIYQTLGVEGAKRPHGYYEIRINLRSLQNTEKIKNALAKLDVSDFYLTWEPDQKLVCPSSIAKYFWDRKIVVSAHNITFENISPPVKQIPTLIDTDIEEVVEWIGMLAHKGDMSPTEDYISTYSEPDCQTAVPTTRISILIAKGFITPITITKLCNYLDEYTCTRDIDNYWAALSFQGCEESLWQFSASSPRMFQSHNSSSTVFFSQNRCIVYSTGQLKYS